MKTRTPHALTTVNDGLKNLVHVHIPKAGGNTVNASVKTYQSLGHRSAHNHRQENCFSTVRNPFDWLISLWHSNWRPSGCVEAPGVMGHLPIGATVAIHRMSIQETWPALETFLYEFNSFEDCPKHHWNKFKSWSIGHRSPRTAEDLHIQDHVPLFSHRHLQTCQTFDPLNSPGEKHSFAAFYIRLERLEEAINQFPENKIRENRPRRVGSSFHKDYRYYYNAKLIDHITAHRKQELDLLGYDFEGPTDDLSVFKINKPFLWK